LIAKVCFCDHPIKNFSEFRKGKNKGKYAFALADGTCPKDLMKSNNH
jgi:hypothetical protein